MFENKPLSQRERAKLNNFYLDVIRHYERVTNQPFMKDDLIVLKLLIEIATPGVLKKQISTFHKSYPDNFTYFAYIYQPTKNMFKNKKRFTEK